MSERPDRGDGRRRRRSRRKRTPKDGAPEASDTPSDARSDERRAEARRGDERPRGPATLKSPRSLERLRTRVEAAAEEIERLRTENAALAARIGELEARPAVESDATVLVLDDDPEALREKVNAFIDAIDQYLADDASSEARDDAADAGD